MKQNLIGGRYSLRDPLGSGGMAEVFLAHDEILKRDVALKVLKEQYANDEGFVELFRREAQSAASLNHPHIVHIYDWGRSENGTYYMAMEYVPGGTLKDRICNEGPLDPDIAARLGSQVAQALGFAHERGVIHRDIKPRNILLTEAGDAKVADFGIARAAAATTTSRSNLILGTAGYMPPEQAKGEPVGPRSDLYSLGVVLYEMLTGEVPYEADTPVTAAMMHVTEPPRSPREANPEVPEEIDALVLRLLAKDPADRYESAAELVKDLRRVGDGLSPAFARSEPAAADRAVLSALPVPANPGGAGESDGPYIVYGRRFRKLPWAIGAAFVALLVLLGGSAWGSLAGSQEQAWVQHVARGSLGGFAGAFEKGERAGSPKEEFPDAGGLPEDEGRGSSKAETGSLKLGDLNLASSDAVLQNGVIDQDPGTDVAVEPDTEVVSPTVNSEPEQVSASQEASEGSAEETSQEISDAGHRTAGTTTQRSSEPAGTAVETDPEMGSTVERGTSVSTVINSGSASQEGSNGEEDDAPEASPAPKQQSKTKKRDQETPELRVIYTASQQTR